MLDLQQELDMSPRRFEDKLLTKLREEINISKEKMEKQLILEMQEEQARIVQMNQKQQRYLSHKNKLRTGLKSAATSQHRGNAARAKNLIFKA